MNLTYRYSASPAENISREYAITLKLSPANWEKEISKFENRINGPLELQIPLDWNRILSDWKQIEKETNYNFRDPNIKFQAYIRISADWLESTERGLRRSSESCTESARGSSGML